MYVPIINIKVGVEVIEFLKDAPAFFSLITNAGAKIILQNKITTERNFGNKYSQFEEFGFKALTCVFKGLIIFSASKIFFEFKSFNNLLRLFSIWVNLSFASEISEDISPEFLFIFSKEISASSVLFFAFSISSLISVNSLSFATPSREESIVSKLDVIESKSMSSLEISKADDLTESNLFFRFEILDFSDETVSFA